MRQQATARWALCPPAQDVIQGAFMPGAKLGIEQLRAAYAVGATPCGRPHRLSAEGFVVVEGSAASGWQTSAPGNCGS